MIQQSLGSNICLKLLGIALHPGDLAKGGCWT